MSAELADKGCWVGSRMIGMSKRRSRRNRSPSRRVDSDPARGFDLGDVQAVFTVADVDFQTALRDANIFACAYGEGVPPGLTAPIPYMTLVCEHREHLERAFGHFARWGCVEDGDAVDITVMLRKNGSYQLMIGPEPRRASFRMSPETSLLNVLSFVSSYVKIFDTTSSFVRDVAAYNERAISPIFFGGAVASAETRTPRPEGVEPIVGLPPVLKFRTRFIDEWRDPDNIVFNPREVSEIPPAPAPDRNPESFGARRLDVIDTAFPVTRERVRRAQLGTAVRDASGFESVSDAQIDQACINLLLSSELGAADHYAGLSGDLNDAVWAHVRERFERATNEALPHWTPDVIRKQIALDVGYALARFGMSVSSPRFAVAQAFFRRKGFDND